MRTKEESIIKIYSGIWIQHFIYMISRIQLDSDGLVYSTIRDYDNPVNYLLVNNQSMHLISTKKKKRERKTKIEPIYIVWVVVAPIICH